ncbi:hypothetical protein [Actinocorallia longicatena]|uniref:UDP-2,4-diacetamido-2,4, 6-trideoxy-beta-L-altropyranose hydrolase n=1 Tax=Actinocorallia longicatena TaxID=111803 RepID=A0ABP6QH45_9ACTN
MRIGVRCDARERTGAGHLIRCVALAEELRGRGAEVVFLGTVTGPPWLLELMAALGVPLVAAPDEPERLAGLAVRLGLDRVVVDSYETDPGCCAALREAGIVVLAIVDDTLRGQHADLYLDQNLGAEDRPVALPEGSTRLAGTSFVLLRDSVRRLRPERPRTHTPGRPGVLCFLGGTDATQAAPEVAARVLATGAPVDAMVVAVTDEIAERVAALRTGPGQTVTPIRPHPELPAVAAAADLVIGAAGTTTWELLCLGVPMALVMVAENQRLGYDAVVARGLAAGLAEPDAPEELLRLLTDPGAREVLARRGHGLVDGRGRERVADALLTADPRSAACP